MGEEKKIADEANEAIRAVLDEVGLVEAALYKNENMRIAWTHATHGAHKIALSALSSGKNLESISIVSVDGGLEVRYTITENGSINTVSVGGVVSV